MKAVILAAGKGTRMGELTQELPKPMLEVQGKPILQHIIEGIRSAGVRSFCIVTGWRAEVIEQHFGDGSRCGVEMTYVRQTVQDGTGKAPEYAKEFVDDDAFLLTYGDILVPPGTYADMVRRFEQGDCSGVVTATSGEDVKKGGINVYDPDFIFTRVVEKPSEEQLADLRASGAIQEGQPIWYNAGIYIFKPVVFEFTARLQKSPRGEYELTDAINDLSGSGHRLAGVPIQGRWVDVRDPEVLKSIT